MKFSEYIIDKLQNTAENLHVLLFGQGGVGKTYNLYELYEALLNSDIIQNGRKVIPVYVPLRQYESRGNENSRIFIREYFWKNYYPNQRLEEHTLDNLESLIFKAEECTYHFLFMCDGINEVHNS